MFTTIIFQNVYDEKPIVQFTFPTGETSTQLLYGNCEPVARARELSMICKVQNEGITYLVGLYSKGSNQLFSSLAIGDDTLLVQDMTCNPQ